MKRNRLVFLIGFLLYIGSFFVPAVKDSGSPISASGYVGFTCAWVTLLTPWGSDGMTMLIQGRLR